VYRALFEAFGAECVAAIWAGAGLSERDSAFLAMLLDAREASGQRLLRKMAGADACIDTLTGRCGHMPRFVPSPEAW
jgi:hypothetical protein